MSGVQISLMFAVGITLVAAVWDQRTGFIPNAITYPLFWVGALAHLFLTLSRFPRANSLVVVLEVLAGASLCALVPFLLWRKSAMGGGDVKLLGGLGALLGPSVGLELELYAFLCAAAIAPIVLAHRGQLIRTAKRSLAMLTRPFRKVSASAEQTPEPFAELRFGPAICAATLLVAVLEW